MNNPLGELFGPAFTEIFGDDHAGTQKQEPVYKASPIKRTRRTKAQVDQLERQIFEVLEEDRPQSVRHVFYRMTNPRLPEPVDKTDRGYRHVQTRCTAMRRGGRLPYHWFADMTRRGYFVNTYADASDFILTMQRHYRADLWRDAACRCEVWAESRSIASVLLDLCSEMAVDLYSCGGFPSMTFVYEAAQANNGMNDDRPLHVLYVGDYDPAGVLIDRNLEPEIREHLNDNIELKFTRLAINPEQIARYDLPTRPRKKSDRRELHIEQTVEAEAMPTRILRGIVRDAVEVLLPAGALYATQVAELSERAHLVRMADMLAGNEI